MTQNRNAHATDGEGNRAILVAAFILSLCALGGHNFAYVLAPDLSLSQEVAIRDSGSAVRVLGYAILLLVSLWGLLGRRTRRSCADRPLLCLLIIALGWMALSLLWSDMTYLTVKTWCGELLLWAGCAGVSRQLTMGEIRRACLIYTGGMTIVGLGWEMIAGAWTPLAHGYRFCGTLDPNSQGLLCTMLVITLFCCRPSEARHKNMRALAMVMSIVLLILTGSRGAMAALVVAMLGAAAMRKQWIKASVAVVAVGVVSVTLLIGMFGDLSGVLAEIRSAGTLQRDMVDAQYIGGARSEVWRACLVQLADRPLLGFGYGAFWNPQRELKFQDTVGWTVTQAHCGYLEAALDVGLVGLLMMLAMYFTAVARYGRAYRLNGRDDDKYATAVLIAFLTVMCVESVNATTYITHVLAICMVTRQALGVVLPQQVDGRLVRSIPMACTQT